MRKNLFTALPQNMISRIAGRLTQAKWSKYLIKPYINFYHINQQEAEKPVEDYRHLKDFFTRKLKPGMRPVNRSIHSVVSPVDGTLSQIGQIEDGHLIQAKGITYTLDAFLNHDETMINRFKNGTFLTIYLSPKDYHRVHVPLDGEVVQTTYVPGKLFPVNEWGVQRVPGLFTQNERLISYLETKAGTVGIAKVGAFIVGSVKVAYSQDTTNVKKGTAYSTTWEKPTSYAKGDELGLFRFGSTVILLFEPGALKLHGEIVVGKSIKMGEKVGVYFKKESV